MRTEYMVYGNCNGQSFREFFKTIEQAKDYADKFRRWHGGNDFCYLAKVDITEFDY